MFHSKPSSHLVAVLEALLVTFLWSTSWVLIKIGLADIPALTFAGLRYMLAFLCLLPFTMRLFSAGALRALTRQDWIRLALLGLLYYAVTQGAQFIGLFYLPAVTVSLLFNFTSVLVALFGIAFLNERPSPLQWAGVLLFVIGTMFYFYPVSFPAGQAVGLAVMLVGVTSNALSSVLGRSVNRDGRIPPVLVTTISMGIGAVLLLGAGLGVQGMPDLSLSSWAIIAWLAVVNTALAFTLWNHSLRTLPAMESSIINNTMLIQIAVLGWLFLGEMLNWQEIGGMVLAGMGALLVQLRLKSPAIPAGVYRLWKANGK